MVDELWLDHEGTPSFCGSSSDDSLLDQILKTTTCTHAHACIPSGPDLVHTHTCYHTHAQVFAQENNEIEDMKAPLTKPRRTSGNKEAVRRYREKRKAHTAYLEEEVRQLRALNHQLIRKLQSQAVLEAEVLRLKNLLTELKGRIDSEVDVFPFQRTCSDSLKEGIGGCRQLDNFDADGTAIVGRPRERICIPVITHRAVDENGDTSNIGSSNDQMISSSFYDR